MVIYAALGLILSMAAMSFSSRIAKRSGRVLAAGASSKTVAEVIDRLLVVLLLVEILHTERISIRSPFVVSLFLVLGLIATIRRKLVITLDAANLTSAANWANDGQAKLRASCSNSDFWA
jgi:hypothetical protein